MNDRGVSVALNYVLALAITTLLMTGLLFATGTLVEDRREAASRAELRVVGQRVAAGLMAADRLAQADGSAVAVVTDGPPRVAGLQYTISLNGTSQEVVLRTADEEVVIRVPFHNTTRVADSSATGGTVRVVLTDPGGPNEALEVRSG